MSAALSMTFTPPQVAPGRYLVGLINEAPSFRQEFLAEYSLLDLFIEPSRRALLTPANLCARLASVARLLDAAHQQGLVHRNLHPAALIWDKDGNPAIHHWEQALSLEQAGAESSSLIGTPGYMPPEQVRRETRFEPRSDLFSLGAILYEGLTGKVPFDGKNALEIGLATLEKEATPAQEVAPGCPLALSLLCEKLLEKNPSDRLGSALELVEALELSAKDASPDKSDAAFADTMDSTPAVIASENPQPSSQRSNASQPSPFMSANQVERLSRATGLPQVPQGSYEVLGELGRGGLGRVNCAQDKRLQRVVAVKELLRHNNQAKERFLREALLTARLQHPGIIPIYEAGVWPSGEFFYSMKMVQGEPLDKLISKYKTLEERLGLLPQLLAASEAMAYAHSQKIIHRDLKPANILVGEYGETVVIDWGLAKDLTTREVGPDPINEDGYRANADNGLTVDGAIMGTPAYMPPEQAKGKQVDERADVYSLGAILYHMLAGASPYQGRNSRAVLLEVAQGKVIPLEDKQQGTPKDLLAIVKKAMDIEAERRYPTAEAFAKDLKKFLTGQLVEAYQYTTFERFGRWFKKNKGVLSVAAASLAVLVGVGGYSLYRVYDEQVQRAKAEEEKTAAVSEKLALQDAENQKLKEEKKKAAIAEVKRLLEENPSAALKAIKALPGDISERTKEFWRQDAYSRGVPSLLADLSSPVSALAVSQSGALFMATQDGAVYEINPENKTKNVLRTSGDKIIGLDLAQDKNLLFGAGTNGQTFFRDLIGGKNIELPELPKVSNLYSWLSSSGSNLLLVSLDTKDAFVENIDSKKILKLIGQEQASESIRFSQNEEWVASGSADGNVYLWNISKCMKENKDCKGVSIFSSSVTKPVGIRFTKDNSRIYFVTSNGGLFKYDLVKNKLEQISSRLVNTIRLEISPDDSKLSIATVEGIHLWDLKSLQYERLPGLQKPGDSIVFSKDSTMLIANDDAFDIWVWDLVDNTTRRLSAGGGMSSYLSFNSDDKYIVSASIIGEVFLWNLEQIQGKSNFKETDAIDVNTSTDGKYFSTSEKNGDINLWPIECLQKKCEAPKVIKGNGVPFSETRFSPKAPYFAGVDEAGKLYLLDLRQDTPRILMEKDAINLSFSPNGEFLAVAAANHNVELWELSSGQHSSLSAHQDLVSAVAFSPDSQILASTGFDGTIRLWNVSTKKLESTSQEMPLALLEWSPSGGSLVAADLQFQVHEFVLDNHLIVERRTLSKDAQHQAYLRHLSISPDGAYLLSTDSNQQAFLWDLKSGESRQLPAQLGGAWLTDSILSLSPGGWLRLLP